MITPQNEQHQLELSVLGYILANGAKPYLAGDVVAVCPPKAFMHSDTRHIAEAVVILAATGRDADLVGVMAELKARGALASVGGAGVVSALAIEFGGHIWTETGLMDAARQIASEARKREAQTDLSAIMRESQTPGVTAESIAESMHRTAAMLESDAGAEVSFDAQLAEYTAALDSQAGIKPVRTPWKSLNAILRGGIRPGELAILAARPSVGKSAFALNFAWSVACSGKKALFNSLEMDRSMLIDRLVSNVGNIDVGRFREGTTPDERLRAKMIADSMRGRPLVVYDSTAVTVGDIRHRIRIAQRGKAEVGLVVVDYLQLLTARERSSSREREVAEMSRALKCIAGDLGVPLLVLAQLNRRSEEAKRGPLLSDLRESGAIEQDADIVIFLHQARQSWHADEPIEVIVAKGRSSGVGKTHLIFHRRFQRFMDSDETAYVDAIRQEERAADNQRQARLDEL